MIFQVIHNNGTTMLQLCKMTLQHYNFYKSQFVICESLAMDCTMNSIGAQLTFHQLHQVFLPTLNQINKQTPNLQIIVRIDEMHLSASNILQCKNKK